MTLARVPVSTYRLQITADFTLDDAAAQVDYLRDLGVDWIYLSPILRSEPGSNHGYDVIDHALVDPERGGSDGLARLSAAAHAAGLGVLVDIVPNHVGVATPTISRWWDDVLRFGPASRYAEAFDVDWPAGGGKVLLPVLGSPGDVNALTVDGDHLVYYGARFPITPGSSGGSAAEVHQRQHYELIDWRRGDAELNYRRFFTVSTLAAVRVELPAVFAESHEEIQRWVSDGLVDGLRIDHPDGLFDPAAYLDQLATAIDGRYVLVEKILEPGEPLRTGWRCDGTTGYDALGVIDRVLIDPAGERGLTDLDTELRGGRALDWEGLVHERKRAVADQSLNAEVRRLARLVDPPADAAGDALAELLACFPVYRSYFAPDQSAADRRDDLELVSRAASAAAQHRPDLRVSIDAVAAQLVDPDSPMARRFQQTSGMVMAKGVEDCAFYRYTRLLTLTEVGADPAVFAVSVDEFHRLAVERGESAADSMVALTTHDTKRSEDTRARLSVLAEVPYRWAEFVRAVRELIADLPLVSADGPMLNLLLQSAVGAWPIDAARLGAAATKAAREAGVHTTHLDPAADYESQLADLVGRVCGDDGLSTLTGRLAVEIDEPGWSNSLSAKLLALTGPGVPDTYQGTELWDHSLMDPDNRRPVDYQRRRALLAELGVVPPIDADGAAKLLVVVRALAIRRTRPELFTSYHALTTDGGAADHLIAFDRGGAVTLVTRLPVGLAARGGWGNTTVRLTPGRYRDAFTGQDMTVDTTPVPVSPLLAALPVALLIRNG